MAVHYRTQGIIFKKQDRFEADRIFSVFTQDFGRLEILAKAIRKITSKLRGGIEIFSLSELEFIQGKSQKTLTDAVLIERFSNITNDLDKFEVANRIAGVLDNLITSPEKDDNIFNLLNETFNKLNNFQFSIFNFQLLYYYFLWNFLSLLGYKPELYQCAVCQRTLEPENLYFSNKEGGIICKNCLDSDKNACKITPDLVKILRIILKKDWQTLSKIKLAKTNQDLLNELSNSYYLYILSYLSVYTENRHMCVDITAIY